MKTVITTREFDDAGNCVKESTHEYVTQPLGACVCFQPWNSILPRHCPLHYYGGHVTVDTNTYTLYNTSQ